MWQGGLRAFHGMTTPCDPPGSVMRGHIRTRPQVHVTPEPVATCKVDKAHSCPPGARSGGEMDPEQRWAMGLLSPEEGQSSGWRVKGT